MVDIKLMLGRFNPPDEIQGPDSLCVGGELLFPAEKLVTSPQFELPLSARNTRVSMARLWKAAGKRRKPSFSSRA